eukprot:XP_001703087.1 predicted protein [Chlamydomonas reinhardtii]
MSDERPSDALQPAAKKRAGGGQGSRDDPEEDDAPCVDPGSWTADATASRERRKVHAGKLFEYDSAAGKWRERGAGELRVNSGNLRLLLNARIVTNMARMNGANGVSFGCVNTAAPVDPKEEPKKEEAGKEGEDAKHGGGAVRTWAFRTKGEDKNLSPTPLTPTTTTPDTPAGGEGAEGGGAEDKPDAFVPSEDPGIKPVVQDQEQDESTWGLVGWATMQFSLRPSIAACSLLHRMSSHMPPPPPPSS